MSIKGIQDAIISFVKKLVSDSSEVGSKRVVGLSFALTIITAVIVALCGGTILPQWMFLELLSSTLILFGYNTYLTSKKAVDLNKQETTNNE